jgi:hypothetical protein
MENDSPDLTTGLYLEPHAPLPDHTFFHVCPSVSVVDFSPVHFLGHFS